MPNEPEKPVKLFQTDYTLAQAIKVAVAPMGAHPNDTRPSECSSMDGGHTSEEWDLNAGWQESLNMLQNGWGEFSNEFKQIAGQFQLPGACDTIQYVGSESGDEVNVQAFLSGEYETFHEARLNESNGMSNTIELLVHIGAHCCVLGENMKRRGAAILALAEALESCGKNVGITVCCTSRYGNPSELLHMTVRVKEPQEYCSFSRLAFFLCHPAMFRRIGFRLKEIEPDEIKIKFNIHGGYGRSANLPVEAIPANTLYMPTISDCEDSFQDNVSTQKWVREQLVKAGIEPL